tara:strand:- start:219 stop:452 length:234 start_codon:yes stop_codon:yes gene_type:complete
MKTLKYLAFTSLILLSGCSTIRETIREYNPLKVPDAFEEQEPFRGIPPRLGVPPPQEEPNGDFYDPSLLRKRRIFEI